MERHAITAIKVDAIKSGKVTASANLEEKVARIEKYDGAVKAFIETYFDDARKKAAEIDAKIKAGKPVGPLAGLVVAVKNVLAVKDRKLTCASKMLENYVSPYDAAVVEKLRAADAIIVGSLNCDEFACGSDNTKSAFFATVNPVSFFDEKNEIANTSTLDKYVPGGSSGASAAAVAAGFCDLTLATDTGGSIRCPAAFCGVTGFKPTYGTVSRYGMADMAMSFEQIGPMAPDAYGCALLLSVISGRDYRDSTTSKATAISTPAPDFGTAKNKIRIGVPKEFFDGANPQVAKAVKDAIGRFAQKSGCELVDISIPAVKFGIPAYYLLVYSEFASAMQKYDGFRYGANANVSEELIVAVSKVRTANIGKECKRRIMLGTYITTKEHKDAWYTKALKARTHVRAQFDGALAKCDFILGPTMPNLAWKIGEKAADPLQSYLEDVLTVPANLCGLPAGSVPCARIGKLPVGLQVIGRRGADYDTVCLMAQIEEALSG
ncbi:MAG: Asp-tRNA(Asn)/Glu-tRNA(Gln) amidotransferase subunit GatA [Candidatus Micrarchaeia archaeon]|jgi:aspartyl-tRNA(Asn)/glutamyl-tRNA(Gln) amidotransferase subunit A